MRRSGQNIVMRIGFGSKRSSVALLLLVVLGLFAGRWLALPDPVSDQTLATNSPGHVAVAPPLRVSRQKIAPAPDLRQALASVRFARRQAQQLAQERLRARLDALHADFSLHGVGSQLYTAWNAPVTIKAMNWYGFEYAPFVPDGLDRAPLDSILATVHDLGFNALRITFADATVEENPVVTIGLAANPALRGLHSLDILGRIIARAHLFGIRIILCNSRSEAGRGPELQSGLWYTARYSQAAWVADWLQLARRFAGDSAFVGVDLRNEPHITGSSLDQTSVLNNGPLWGAFQGTYYRERDWRYAAQTLGNQLLQVDPHVLVIVEGVQLYLDAFKRVMTGGLWGSNLIGVQYDPIVLSRPSQLVYSVHEYGPHMWQGDWFNPNTTYASLSDRWMALWGYLLTARKILRAPIFVGEFGTCHEYYACIGSSQGWKQGFWFQSFVRFLAAHPQVGWAYWALNPTGPFQTQDDDFYSLFTRDWKHYYPIITYGLAPLLREPSGVWENRVTLPSSTRVTDLVPEPGCLPGKSCTAAAVARLAAEAAPPKVPASTLPVAPAANTSSPVRVTVNVPYVQPSDGVHVGDIYLPRTTPVRQHPAVVIVHGGSWAEGSKGKAGTVALAHGFAARGYIAFDVNVRLAGHGGNFPHDVQDVKDAEGYLASQAARYGVDPRRLAVVGAGAGGYIALLAAYTPNSGRFASPHYPYVTARIGAVANFFGPSDLGKLEQHSPDPAERSAVASYMGTDFTSNPGLYGAASPMSYLATAVSTIQFDGLADRSVTVWQPYDLYRSLRDQKVPTQLVDLPGSPHTFTEMSAASRAHALEQTVAFFNSTLYRSPAAG